jgi:hypothetical protein
MAELVRGYAPADPGRERSAMKLKAGGAGRRRASRGPRIRIRLTFAAERAARSAGAAAKRALETGRRRTTQPWRPAVSWWKGMTRSDRVAMNHRIDAEPGRTLVGPAATTGERLPYCDARPSISPSRDGWPVRRTATGTPTHASHRQASSAPWMPRKTRAVKCRVNVCSPGHTCVRSDLVIGYARLSTEEQELTAQRDALTSLRRVSLPAGWIGPPELTRRPVACIRMGTSCHRFDSVARIAADGRVIPHGR